MLRLGLSLGMYQRGAGVNVVPPSVDGLYLNGVKLTDTPAVPYSTPIVLTQNSTFTQQGAGDYTISGAISGAFTVTVDVGSNTLTMTGAQNYTGATTVTTGTLRFSTGAGTLNSPSYNVASGATLNFNLTTGSTGNYRYFDQSAVASTVTGSGTVRYDCPTGQKANIERIAPNQSAGGVAIINSGIYAAGANGPTTNLGSLTINTGAVFATNSVWYFDALNGGGSIGQVYSNNNQINLGVNNGSGTFTGTVGEAPYNSITGGKTVIVKAGTGTQTFSGDQAYTGTTTVNAGTLKVSDTQLAASAYTVAANATLEHFIDFNNLNQTRVASVAGAGTFLKNGAALLSVDAQLTFNMSVGAMLEVRNGIMLSTNASLRTATTNRSRLKIGTTSFILFEGGAAGDAYLDSIEGSGGILRPVGNMTLRVGLGDGSATYNGFVSNAFSPNAGIMSVIKAGTGTQTFANTSLHTGGTTVNAGTLIGSGSQPFGPSGAITVNSTGTLDITPMTIADQTGLLSRVTRNAGGTVKRFAVPSDSSTRKGWFDFTDANTITLNAGNVASITDKSLGLIASQATAANQPALASGRATFTNAKTLSNPVTGLGNSTIVAVGFASAIGDFIGLNKISGGANNYGPRINQFPTTGKMGATGSGLADVTSTTNTPTTLAVMTWRKSGSNVFLSLNGGSEDTLVISGLTNLGTGEFCDVATNNNFIAAGFIFDSDNTTTTAAQLVGMAAWQNGLQGSLPVGHPYKSAAPIATVTDGGTAIA